MSINKGDKYYCEYCGGTIEYASQVQVFCEVCGMVITCGVIKED